MDLKKTVGGGIMDELVDFFSVSFLEKKYLTN